MSSGDEQKCYGFGTGEYVMTYISVLRQTMPLKSQKYVFLWVCNDVSVSM